MAMSETQPNIDAILASIRSRMTDGGAPAPIEAAPAPVAAEMPAAPDIGAVVIDSPAMTLDGLVRSMLEPLLQKWLDANMPEIVERMAQAEIKRLTGRD